jgi:hypothetical protein
MTSNGTPQERIRALMDEDPLDMTDAAIPHVTEDLVDNALADAGLSVLSAEAQNVLLALTSSGAGLEPATRDRFVKAASRGLQTRRDSHAPLPRLLFIARQARNEDIASVATSVSVDAETLRNVERGHAGLEALGAQGVADWVTHFGVPIDQAKEALAKALWLQTGAARAAASAAGADAVEDSEFFQSVIHCLQPGINT